MIFKSDTLLRYEIDPSPDGNPFDPSIDEYSVIQTLWENRRARDGIYIYCLKLKEKYCSEPNSIIISG